ncbi:hypothetical protein AKO1_012831 [Acrasis kona]|uniref:Glucose/Sorbosone dehydrogenase domain-containing protein n=1 Tax=Acrasis kona TaxID=1008807 RepID=A0AAW2YWQ6_9EUKA
MHMLNLAVIGLLLCSITFAAVHLDRLKLPKGYKAEVLIEGVQKSRQLTTTPDEQWLFIGSYAKSIYAYHFETKKLITLATKLSSPIGTAYDPTTDSLIVSEIPVISVFRDIVKQLNQGKSSDFQKEKLRNYPTNEWHGAKYLGFRNGRVFVPVGSPCNHCLKDQSQFGILSSFALQNPEDYKLHAIGIRNTVGFDWHPETGKLWFSENGRDEWGNDRPGDELNMIEDLNVTRHYGFPYCYEKDVVDPIYNKDGNCNKYVPAKYVLGPHVAVVGMTFYKGAASQNKNIALIAEHGSWNRDIPLGYRVSMVDVSNPSADSYKIFIEGWLNLPGENDSEHAWGRPSDVLSLKDGSILISDDKANVVYKITYVGN